MIVRTYARVLQTSLPPHKQQMQVHVQAQHILVARTNSRSGPPCILAIINSKAVLSIKHAVYTWSSEKKDLIKWHVHLRYQYKRTWAGKKSLL